MSDETKYDVVARGELDKLDDDGYAALHYAANSGNVELAKALLDLGADIKNRRSEFGDKTGSIQLFQFCQWVTL